MNGKFRGMHRLVLGLVLAAGAGCAPGMMEDVWGDVVHPDRGGVYDRGGYRDDVRGEVRGVDTRNRRIQVRESGGRSVTAYYDGRTRVEYRGRDYRVSSLERGDRVSMRVRRDGGRYYADRVYVTESARDRGGWSRDDRDRRERDRSDAWRDSGRLYGTVQSVNRGQSSFQVRGQSGERVVVYLPRNAGRSTEDRFRRLRRGDRVQVQVRPLDRDRAELRRFL